MLSVEELQLRAALFHAIHEFFFKNSFLHVDTPLRQPVVLPESNIVPLSSGDWFLQTSPELCMKRLIASGCEKIYQICPCFRKEERGRRHLEEFTMLEWYRKSADYFDLMGDCEELLLSLAASLHEFYRKKDRAAAKDSILFDSAEYLAPPWPRIKVEDAFCLWSPVSLNDALAEDRFDEIVVEYIEPRLGIEKPAFLYNYPASLASLSRKKETDPEIAERFELYLHGIEIANGFSELADPCEQRDRFGEELDKIKEHRGESMLMPEKFLRDLTRMGETAGIALGIDRLFMLFLGKDDISDGVSFGPADF